MKFPDKFGKNVCTGNKKWCTNDLNRVTDYINGGTTDINRVTNGVNGVTNGINRVTNGINGRLYDLLHRLCYL